jgi:hypothetical protein
VPAFRSPTEGALLWSHTPSLGEISPQAPSGSSLQLSGGGAGDIENGEEMAMYHGPDGGPSWLTSGVLLRWLPYGCPCGKFSGLDGATPVCPLPWRSSPCGLRAGAVRRAGGSMTIGEGLYRGRSTRWMGCRKKGYGFDRE